MKTFLFGFALIATLATHTTAKASDGTITFTGRIVDSHIYADKSQAPTMSVNSLNAPLLNDVISQYWSKSVSWDKDNVYPNFAPVDASTGIVKTVTYL